MIQGYLFLQVMSSLFQDHELPHLIEGVTFASGGSKERKKGSVSFHVLLSDPRNCYLSKRGQNFHFDSFSKPLRLWI